MEVEDEGVIGMGDTNSGLLAVELVCWDGVVEEEGIGDAEVETERGIRTSHMHCELRARVLEGYETRRFRTPKRRTH